VNPIEVEQTFMSLLCGSPVETLQGALTVSKLMGGFGNRMTFVMGTPRPVKDWPPRPDFQKVPKWEHLFEFEGEVRLDEGAMEAWSIFYKEFSARQSLASPFFQVLAERIPEKILKTLIVMAAWERTNLVDSEMLGQAIHWGRYLERCLIDLAPAFEDADRQTYQAIQKGCNTRAKLGGALSHVIPTQRLRSAISNLKWLGLIDEDGDRLVALDNPPTM
jgi:hypothetical protein